MLYTYCMTLKYNLIFQPLIDLNEKQLLHSKSLYYSNYCCFNQFKSYLPDSLVTQRNCIIQKPQFIQLFPNL